FVDVLDAGFHLRLPQPIETVLRPSMKLQQINIGFDVTLDNPASTANVPRESVMLTGDENIVDIDFTVFWQVRDAAEYEFQVEDVDKIIKAVEARAMREVVGQAKIEIVQTGGRGDLEEKVRSTMQSALEAYKAGVTVTR